jgi:hypothetical protein
MGNQRIIDVVGAPEQVAEFVKSQPISLEASPLTDEEWQQAKIDVQSQEERQQVKDRQDSEEPIPIVAAEQMPGLQVTYYLVKPQVPAPYRVHFEVDPRPYYYHVFYLQGTDTTASVNYQAVDGTVRVCVSTPSGNVWSGPSVRGTASKAGVRGGSYCSVSVYRSTGDPKFSLSGDWYIV